MSNHSDIFDYLFTHSGILAACIDGVYRSNPRACTPVPSWGEAVCRQTKEMVISAGSDARAVVHAYTITGFAGDPCVVVVIPTGDAIAKSLRRMVRRAIARSNGTVASRVSSTKKPALTVGGGMPRETATEL